MIRESLLPTRSGLRLLWALAYGAMLLATVFGFWFVTWLGSDLAAPAAVATNAAEAAAPHGSSPLPRVLLAMAAVILAGRIISAIIAPLGQPPVIAEILAGIALGPSLLGRLAPGMGEFLLPASAAPYLSVVAQLGVILYMFVIGLELDTTLLRNRGHITVAISHASIVVPFLLGAVLALALYPIVSSSDVPFTVFALFLGTSMSVTAFPVLSRILTDRGMNRTEIGAMALTCAASDDVTAWCLLALVVGIARSQLSGALLVLAMAAAFIVAMIFVVRPLLNWVLSRTRSETNSRGFISAIFIALLLSALATEALGIHAVFGAFLLGAIMPKGRFVESLIHKLEDVVSALLLPAFFAITGMRTRIGLMSDAESWLWCGVIVLTATVGKFGGTLAAARLAGVGWKESSALGVLMNTRGLMELIVLNIGLDLGVISPRLFAMMVLMAIATTVATTPILAWLGVPQRTNVATDETSRRSV